MLAPDIVGPKQDPERLHDSVNILLSLQVSIIRHRIEPTSSKKHPFSGRDSFTCLQSKNGGMTAWEPAGAPKWLEVRTKPHNYFQTTKRYFLKHLRSCNLLHVFVSVAQSHRNVFRHCD